jgi:dihydrodiol dehydrogenase / D-xylose 1-dehydrogenase (NADP)
VRSLLSSGAIGHVSYVSCDFGWSSAGCGPEHRIWDPKTGGYIFDIGQYCAHWALLAYPGRPVEKVFASGRVVAGVDHSVAASVFFGAAAETATGEDVGAQGGVLQFIVTGEATTEERLTIQGSNGRIVVHAPHHTPTSVSLCINTGKADKTKEDVQMFEFPLPVEVEPKTWNFPGSIGFAYEIAEVGRCVLEGKKQSDCFTLEESIAMAQILGDIRDQVLGNSSCP